MQNLQFTIFRKFPDSKLYILNSTFGFTLIELLAVISIIVTVSLIGYASYRDFNSRQQLSEAVRLIKSDLQLAQQKAASGEKPSGCTGDLVGWKINFTSTSYDVIADCATDDATEKTVNIPFGITKNAGPVSILFKVLALGAEDATFTFLQTATEKTATIIVTKAGKIE
ncbi:prepilin-type N-terminal cleavage/methylation domain-containing protein [Candidatus Microgenomates bacterium]|nr:prepilin-type N-terminal cleavage/methylation domain-containing protein [Candidatus Microgenomates bacterium]